MILAATGHRPNKLGGYSVEANERLYRFAFRVLDRLQPEGIISGMALGWDTAWVRAGIKHGIPVTAAVPFKGQETAWPKESQDAYNAVLSQCTAIEYVCEPGYAAWKMQVRNKWMVDNCTQLIALWDGSSGGTGNCVAYAAKANKDLRNLWFAWLKFSRQKV